MLVPGSREFSRYGEAVAVLARHGLGMGAARTGLRRFIPFSDRLGRGRGGRPATEPEHVRLACEELGVAFIKLGQVLSTREDLLPPAYAEELARLQESAPQADPADIRAVVERELGCPVDAIFERFDDEPLASASIGQVHGARLRGGGEVVVKVQKPGVEQQVEVDLAVMRRLAEHAEHRVALARQYGVASLVEEMKWTLRAELDYVREGRNAERFSRQFADEPRLRAPRIDWEHTTARVLTMERVDGIHIDDVAALDAAGIDRTELARRLIRMMLASVLVHGFFHADPHPGNYLVESDGTIVVLDFGMSGRVDDEMRTALVTLFGGVVDGDVDQVIDSLARLGVRPAPEERLSVQRDVGHVLDAYYGLDLEHLSVGQMLRDVAGVARRHNLAFPPGVALLAKTAAMAETLARRLDPDVNPAEEAEDFAREVMGHHYSPAAIAERAADAIGETVALVHELPGQLRRVLRQVESGDFEVRLRRDEINMALEGASALVNRIAAAILGAAIAISMGLVLQVYKPPAWEVFAAIVFFGGPFAVGGFWAWAILSARHRQ